MKKYKVVIRAFTLRRDVAVSLILAEILKRKGCDVVIASCRNFTRLIKYWNPDAIIINTIGQVDNCRNLAPQAAIILFGGEGGNKKEASEAKIFSKRLSSYEKIDKVLLWGIASKNFFHELMPNADHSKLLICGNPRLDLTKYSQSKKNSHRKTIGFIGRYHTLNRYNRIPAIFSMQNYGKREVVTLQVENYFSMIKLMHRILDETEYKISIRPHPLEAPEGYDFMLTKKPFKGRVEIDDSLDLAHWTAKQTVIVAPSSTSFFESYLLDIPVINIDYLTNNIEVNKKLTPNAALSQSVSYNPTDYDEAMGLLLKDDLIPLTAEVADIHLDTYHGYKDSGSSIMKSANAILLCLKSRKRPKGYCLPYFLLDFIDAIYYKREIWRDPLHKNFNYYKRFHIMPKYFNKIVSDILKQDEES